MTCHDKHLLLQRAEFTSIVRSNSILCSELDLFPTDQSAYRRKGSSISALLFTNHAQINCKPSIAKIALGKDHRMFFLSLAFTNIYT